MAENIIILFLFIYLNDTIRENNRNRRKFRQIGDKNVIFLEIVRKPQNE